jgi:acyl carrier protein
MQNRIKKVMAEVFAIDPELINDTTSPGTLSGWDSINQMKLIAALEDEFDIEIDDDEIEEMVNYRVIVAIIESYMEE